MPTTETTSVLLGFSARARHTPRNEAVRADQLLRPELDWPLSADAMVWPTVFETVGGNRTHRGSTMENLWGPLSVLKSVLATELPAGHWPEGSYWIVAVAWMPTPETWDSCPRDASAVQAVISPDTIDKAWEFLGYDVADNKLLSGLSNCLTNRHDRCPDWHDTWAGRLNDHHLFDELADATLFAGAIARRVPTHAPFHPYGLWRVN